MQRASQAGALASAQRRRQLPLKALLRYLALPLMQAKRRRVRQATRFLSLAGTLPLSGATPASRLISRLQPSLRRCWCRWKRRRLFSAAERPLPLLLGRPAREQEQRRRRSRRTSGRHCRRPVCLCLLTRRTPSSSLLGWWCTCTTARPQQPCRLDCLRMLLLQPVLEQVLRRLPLPLKPACLQATWVTAVAATAAAAVPAGLAAVAVPRRTLSRLGSCIPCTQAAPAAAAGRRRSGN